MSFDPKNLRINQLNKHQVDENIKIMDYNISYDIVVTVTTSIVIVLGVANFCFLLKQKNKIPFSNISPLLLLMTISGKKILKLFSII